MRRGDERGGRAVKGDCICIGVSYDDVNIAHDQSSLPPHLGVDLGQDYQHLGTDMKLLVNRFSETNHNNSLHGAPLQ